MLDYIIVPNLNLLFEPLNKQIFSTNHTLMTNTDIRHDVTYGRSDITSNLEVGQSVDTSMLMSIKVLIIVNR